MTLKEMSKTAEKELLKYPILTRRLLFNRGILTEVEAEEFLNPSYERDVTDPFQMLHLEKVVDRIHKAIKNDEKICIFADYDCDGIPGAVIWNDLFHLIKFENFQIYIPDRHKEGYGLNESALKEISEGGAKLLITVDLGITAVGDTEYAKTLGLEVIITDHHLPQEKLPDTLVVNPKQAGDKYPDSMLCGAGVAFKVIQGFIKKYGAEFGIKIGAEKWMLDMVGLATLADMVPLVKENRALALYGLQVLKKTRRPGLLSLFSHAKVDPRNLTEDDITFSICPKLNAASRMDNPMRAFEVLSADGTSAHAHAENLSRLNDERKLIVAQIMRSVKSRFGKREERSVIVVGDPAWRVGVLGLVAGKIVEEYKKPAFVWGLEGGTVIKGSCRSDGSVNLVELMGHLPENSLLEFGGHEGAGGFSVTHEEVHFLEERLHAAYEKAKREKFESSEEIATDAELELDEVNEKTYGEIERLAPFGAGNPKPVFKFSGIVPAGVKKFGKTMEHMELTFENRSGRAVKAIQFFKVPEDFGDLIAPNKKIDLYAHMERNTFGYKKEIRLRIIDVK